MIGGGWGAAVVEQCQKMGFDGPIWPVHPSREEIHGVPCLRTISDLPGVPDAVFLAVNRHLTVEAVAELSAMGAGGAVVFASGFAEAEDDRAAGAELQTRLVAAAGEMPVLGPNCYGLINYLDGALLWPDQHGGVRRDSGVAILTQSSNILINFTMAARGLPIAYAIAAGNQAQTGLADMAMACLADPRVTAIGLHIEGISDIRGFEALAAAARAAGKPLVALKVGRSEAAQRATLTHTASLAGSDAASRAFLNRLAMPVVATMGEFLETLKLLHCFGPLPGRDIASVSCSGGEASIAGDAGEGRAIRYRAFTEAQTARIREVLGPLVTIANPLDYHTFIWGDAARMEACYRAVLSAEFDLVMFIFDFPRGDRCSDAAWALAIEALDRARAATGARVAVTAGLGEGMPEVWAEDLLTRGFAPMIGIDETLAAAEAAARIGEAWARPVPSPVAMGAGAVGGVPMDEAQSKAALAAHGLDVPRGRVLTEDSLGSARDLRAPLALKGLGFAHKTEHGAVRLGLGHDDLAGAAAGIAGAEAFLVEEMVTGALAELIVGVVDEPPYGLTLTLGAGGVLTEILHDSVTLMLPTTEEEVCEAILSLRAAPLLTGYRGRGSADLKAVTRAVMAVQDFALAEVTRLVELDINPLIVTETRAVAADALLRLAEGAPSRPSRPPPAPTHPPARSGRDGRDGAVEQARRMP